MVVLKSQSRASDKSLLIAVISLGFFGLLAVFNASVAVAISNFGDKFYFAKSQLVWLIIGLLLMFLFSQLNYKLLLKLSPLFCGIALVLLVIVLIPGWSIKALGARRWLGIGSITFQPAELTKLALVLYLASFLAKKRSFWHFLLVIGLTLVLVVLEPDLGTATIIAASGVAMFFVSGASLLEIGFLGAAGLITGALSILNSTYRRQRLMAFLNPGYDTEGIAYHIRQALLAIGSGGFLGLGPGQSRQKFAYLPEVTTDSIFAIVAEELGFVGGAALIFLFMFMLARVFIIADSCPDKVGRLLTVGIGAWLGTQVFLNLSAMVALIPLTGVPLPFISYGGSSLIVNLVAIGIVLNVSKHKAVRK